MTTVYCCVHRRTDAIACMFETREEAERWAAKASDDLKVTAWATMTCPEPKSEEDIFWEGHAAGVKFAREFTGYCKCKAFG